MTFANLEDQIFKKSKKIHKLPIPKTFNGLKKRAKQYSIKTRKTYLSKVYPKTISQLKHDISLAKLSHTSKYTKALVFNIAIKYLSKISIDYKRKLAIASKISNKYYTKL